MTKRIVGATLLGLLASLTAAAASCSFPTYNINVGTGGAGDATASASSSSGDGTGGSSSATSSTTSSGTGGASSASSSAASSSAASSSAGVGGFDAGACPIDEDKDGVVSWQCPGGMDCADQDNRAHPGADFVAGEPIMGLKRPGTLPHDFNCVSGEQKKTLTITCSGAICGDTMTHGFEKDVNCGDNAPVGHCGSTLPCIWISDSMNVEQLCK